MDYVDALRGFAILMVVYVHLVNYGLFGLKTAAWMGCAWSPAVVGLTFRMPLFFFVSGLLGAGVYTPGRFRRRVLNRLRRQLWPTLVVCTIFTALCFWDGWRSLLYNDNNEKYWFTQSLVQVFMLYALMARLFDRLSLSKTVQSVWLLVPVGMMLVVDINIESHGVLAKNEFLKYTYLNRSCIYGPFFFSGVLARMWWGTFREIFDRLWPWLICLAIFGVLYGVYGHKQPVYFQFLLRAAGVLGVYGIFHLSARFWSGAHPAARRLSALGRNTLPIYLFHYIILHYLCQSGWLTSLRPLYGGWWEVPVIGLLALTIASLCAATDHAASCYISPLHRLVMHCDWSFRINRVQTGRHIRDLLSVIRYPLSSRRQ